MSIRRGIVSQVWRLRLLSGGFKCSLSRTSNSKFVSILTMPLKRKYEELHHTEHQGSHSPELARCEDVQNEEGVNELNGRDETYAAKELSVVENIEAEEKPLSKNQQKKLRRKQEWEEARESRKAHRKEKRKARRERQKEARKNDEASTCEDGNVKVDGKKRKLQHSTQLPVSFLYDCQFDDLMTDNEVASLGSQLTRAYSDNRNANFRMHMFVGSFGGRLKERFEVLLERNHEQWKGVEFSEAGFVEVAEEAGRRMRGQDGGKIEGALQGYDERKEDVNGNSGSTGFHGSYDKAEIDGSGKRDGDESSDDKEEAGDQPKVVQENSNSPHTNIVYLSSESPETLEKLEPYTTYVIGGLVDKNRHKGICYKRAMDRNIKTAKLPISNFMQMQSRQVLATNHVGEIMLKWLEYGDWGKAFMEVIPRRKGGQLRDGEIAAEDCVINREDSNEDSKFQSSGDGPSRELS